MNLENLYGSHEQLVKVFESALQQNEPLEVFFRLVAIYEQSNKMEVRGSTVKCRDQRIEVKKNSHNSERLEAALATFCVEYVLINKPE